MGQDGPNAMQVGGTHYQTEYQVWDFVENHGLGGLEMSIIKYVCRWREKGNGIMDLEKAIHFLDKLMDLHTHRHRVPKGCAPHSDIVYFCNMQELTSTEVFVVTVISRWSYIDNLLACRAAIQRLIEDA